MELNYGDKHILIEFVPKELWHKLEYKGRYYYEGIGIECKNLVGIKLKSAKDHTVRSILERACRYLGYDEADYPDLGEVIKEKDSGTMLKNFSSRMILLAKAYYFDNHDLQTFL